MWVAITLLIFTAITHLSNAEMTAEQTEIMVKLATEISKHQFYFEERTRSEGQSGIKKSRLTKEGTRPYHATHHTGYRYAAMHNHANNVRTVGLGEYIVVLNGVEFRTRHNDYPVMMPSEISSELHEMQPIPFPPVPESVTSKSFVGAQIEEMREYFKAWKYQDYSERDYRPHFRPVLVYMEGAWFYPDQVEVDGFDSDRHKMAAVSWEDLLSKIKFTSMSGRKQNAENYAYMPKKIIDVKDGEPIFAQWNYRISCIPLKDDLPLNRLRVVDDISTRMRFRQTYEEHVNSSTARYQLNPINSPRWRERGFMEKGYLDELMEQVPGKDNYGANLVDDAFGLTAKQVEADANGEHPVLNSGYYHRYYWVDEPDFYGSNMRRRSYSDESVFMAMTTQESVIPSEVTVCSDDGSDCQTVSQRWSYAIPIEIVYMSPLSNWNPYDIHFKEDPFTPLGKTVTENGVRTGEISLEKAYNGSHNQKYFMTPAEFYEGAELSDDDPADTSIGTAGVLDRNGVLREVRDTGHRIFFPNIPGSGILRQRYPILAVHGLGNSMWQELEAVKDVALEPHKYSSMYRQRQNVAIEEDVKEEILMRLPNGTVDHCHWVILSMDNVAMMKAGFPIQVNTETTNDHSHELDLILEIVDDDPTVHVRSIEPAEDHGVTLTIGESDRFTLSYIKVSEETEYKR